MSGWSRLTFDRHDQNKKNWKWISFASLVRQKPLEGFLIPFSKNAPHHVLSLNSELQSLLPALTLKSSERRSAPTRCWWGNLHRSVPSSYVDWPARASCPQGPAGPRRSGCWAQASHILTAERGRAEWAARSLRRWTITWSWSWLSPSSWQWKRTGGNSQSTTSKQHLGVNLPFSCEWDSEKKDKTHF